MIDLVTVLSDVHDDRLLPAEQEVTGGGTNDDSQTQPHVVCHEDQHQQEAQCHLDDMQERLVEMHARCHCRPGKYSRKISHCLRRADLNENGRKRRAFGSGLVHAIPVKD